ncbi:MAG: hypothetical protein GX616_25005 [Planctomycetes bacterium]|nr:hypothetical protein [Planctomycetota bacterium]
MKSRRTDEPEPSSKRRTIGLIAAMAALVIVAVAVTWKNREEKQPDTPESAMPYICTECKHTFDLTPAGYERLSNDGGVKAPADRDGRGMVLFRCPSCGKFAAVSAIACPKDSTLFAKRLPDGKPGRCPKCNWSYYAR